MGTAYAGGAAQAGPQDDIPFDLHPAVDQGQAGRRLDDVGDGSVNFAVGGCPR